MPHIEPIVPNAQMRNYSGVQPSARERAIFLDRDGTLNVEVERVLTPEDFVLVDGAAEAVRRINQSGYRAIVVTNQAIIGRGECDAAALERVHARLNGLLAEAGAHLDALYYCPHYPDGVCNCRKPAPGLVLDAQSDFHLNLKSCWMIGDSVKDIRLARNTGMRVALVRTGKGGSDRTPGEEPDYTFDTLRDAVEFILQDPPGNRLERQA
jgi:histidinol-phosphate phosphatase family protein